LYCHSIIRLRVVPAVFGMCRKISVVRSIREDDKGVRPLNQLVHPRSGCQHFSAYFQSPYGLCQKSALTALRQGAFYVCAARSVSLSGQFGLVLHLNHGMLTSGSSLHSRSGLRGIERPFLFQCELDSKGIKKLTGLLWCQIIFLQIQRCNSSWNSSLLAQSTLC
jgi:hypothetical protein